MYQLQFNQWLNFSNYTNISTKLSHSHGAKILFTLFSTSLQHALVYTSSPYSNTLSYPPRVVDSPHHSLRGYQALEQRATLRLLGTLTAMSTQGSTCSSIYLGKSLQSWNGRLGGRFWYRIELWGVPLGIVEGRWELGESARLQMVCRKGPENEQKISEIELLFEN